jgi:hypothetical protein
MPNCWRWILFFTLHNFLEVGKTHDLPSKFWQTLADALTTNNLVVFWRVGNFPYPTPIV